MRGSSFRKRILAMLCAIVMAISVMPMPVSAVGDMAEGNAAITLNMAEMELVIDETEEGTLVAALGDNVEPDAAVTWKTSDSAIAEVAENPSDSKEATVTAKGVGTVEIEAVVTTTEGIDEKAVCKVTVKSAPTEITIVRLAGGLEPAEVPVDTKSFQLEVELEPEADFCTDTTIIWEMTDNNIVTLDKTTGLVTVNEGGFPEGEGGYDNIYGKHFESTHEKP